MPTAGHAGWEERYPCQKSHAVERKKHPWPDVCAGTESGRQVEGRKVGREKEPARRAGGNFRTPGAPQRPAGESWQTPTSALCGRPDNTDTGNTQNERENERDCKETAQSRTGRNANGRTDRACKPAPKSAIKILQVETVRITTV